MNHKQKMGYILLGAFIMLIGMSIDNLTSSPVTAQTDGEITCQKLTFVDETGEPLFTLNAESDGRTGSLSFRNKDGKKAMKINNTRLGNSVYVYDRDEKAVVMLHGFTLIGGVIYTKSSEGKSFSTSMSSGEHGGQVKVYGKEGEGTAVISINEHGGRVQVSDKGGEGFATMSTTEHGGRVDVFNKQGKNRAVMSVNEYGNGAISTWDKNGYRQ